ncbi:hypothetical protein AB0M43_10940 [Longispora sp. NPDC051575]|uniref:hypothetical protein n=1 Tax=Longispora sp. NPDC051575 TaxID=3154943 RepID=UPI003448D9C4
MSTARTITSPADPSASAAAASLEEAGDLSTARDQLSDSFAGPGDENAATRLAEAVTGQVRAWAPHVRAAAADNRVRAAAGAVLALVVVAAGVRRRRTNRRLDQRIAAYLKKMR